MPRAPHIVLIMTDQQRWDTLGCLGGSARTPHLDGLASRGTLFTKAYSATPSCVPARASLMTGKDPWNTGILGMGPGQPPCANLGETLPRILGRHGYQTTGIGKMHFSPQRSRQGFHETAIDESARREDPDFVSDYTSWFRSCAPEGADQFGDGLGFNSWVARPYPFEEHLHPTSWTATRAIEAIRHRDPTAPMFLTVSFARPHSPYDPPSWYFDLYEGATSEPAVGDWADVHDVPEDAVDPSAWRGRLAPKDIARARQGYLGSITQIDHQIARVITELQSQEMFQDTVFVFTSDHGDMLGDHHLWRKTYGYEGSAHVPLIVCPPSGDDRGRTATSDAPVQLQDVMPTILDLAGIPIPREVDGRSLVPECAGDTSTRREFVHGEHSTCYHRMQEMQYLTDGRWKYIWLPRIGQEQLFDLTSDPYETIDRAAEPDARETLLQWRGRLVKILASRDIGWTEGENLVTRHDDVPLISPAAAQRVSVMP